jgi:hypothetical protein
MNTLSALQAVKDRFGGLVFLDLTQYDLRTAHHRLGEHTGQQVQKILRQRFDRSDTHKIALVMQETRSCAETLTGKIGDKRLERRLREAVREYLDCLEAWADGAGLAGFEHPALAEQQSISPLELALFLQHDSTGCQTGMYRQEDGSVILWHTEEDIEFEAGSGFDQLRLATFNVGDGNTPVTMHAFIYPDLLPGPAFGWRSDGYTQAVDSLHVRACADQKSGILANILTWLTLRLGSDCEPGKVIRDMGPYFDGYALNAVSIRGGNAHAEKHEFTANQNLSTILGDRPGSYLFQVNIFSQKKRLWIRELEDLPAEDRRLYKRREWYTRKALQNKDHRVGEAGDMGFFFDLICARSGIRWPYANTDMKAYLILRLSPQEAEIWLGHGPALPKDPYNVMHIPLA